MGGSDTGLVVVSNRLPVQISRTPDDRITVRPSAGGLVTALEPAFRRRSGTWIGWPGTTGDSQSLLRQFRHADPDPAYRLLPVALTELEVKGFYRGFSNEVIWPLFHDLLEHCRFDPRYWQAYCNVNDKFARAVADAVEPGDVVWVHDYHLMGVGTRLRALGIENRIGFFNHIPFPAPDIFCRLPWRSELLDGLLDFDLLGFQLERDAQHFLDCLRQLSGRTRAVRYPGGTGNLRTYDASRGVERNPRIDHFPVSIDFERFAYRARSEAVRRQSASIRERLGRRCLVLGVDRLDYSKGLPHKLAAFRHALQVHPRLRGKLTLVQHVVPSREKIPQYQHLRAEIERTVGEINGEFGRLDWTPVHYFYGTLDDDALCAYYNAADICLVTSLKDGMNLVAKEYCAAQTERAGTLVVSEFAGVAEALGRHALVVNPYDVEDVADALLHAYTMSAAERGARMQRLRETVRAHTAYHWIDGYLDALLASGAGRGECVFDSGSAVARRIA